MPEPPRKLFVSYSWTSQEHETWVITLASSLREAGVDVILDKWDLREGHDAYHFMEQMVSNPEIRKVLIICDRKYAEKADGRSGGVGTETQIISPEIYAKESQDKFVVVVAERDENGTPYIPTYYKTRVYIDLSQDSEYAKNFEQLLRWVYDKPLYLKPPLGKEPGFLADEGQPSLATTVYFRRAADAIRNNRPHRTGAFNEYLVQFATGLENLRLPTDGPDFDEKVIKSINQFLPYRNEAIEIFLALGQYGTTPDELRALHRFFEKLLPYMHRPENVHSFRDWDFDNFRFIGHELFLYVIAGFLKHERFEYVGQLLRQPYYVGWKLDTDQATVTFAALGEHLKSLEYRNQRLSLRRLSLHADLLKERATASGLSFQDLMQADFTLFVRDCFDVLRQEKRQEWRPETLGERYVKHRVYSGVGEARLSGAVGFC